MSKDDLRREVLINAKHLENNISKWTILLDEWNNDNLKLQDEEFTSKKEKQLQKWKDELQKLKDDYVEYFV